MKRKHLWVVVGCLLLGVVIASVWGIRQSSFFRQKSPIYVAVVGPMSGIEKISGDNMRQGVRLYLETHKELLGGRDIQLLEDFNDQNNSQRASRVATEISENNVLLILGHYFSLSSAAAGEIYQKKGIPAITASASADDITLNNEWYFRTIPNNDFQGKFIANYVKNVLKKTATCVIYDQDIYGTTLAKSYANAAKALGLDIQEPDEIDKKTGDGKRIWMIDREASDLNLESRIKDITAKLLSLPDPGAIFLATHEAESVKIITAVKLPGTNYTIIGPDSFATPTFINEFQQAPQEQAKPGYYSNGIYAVSPFIGDLASDEAVSFKREFQRKYHAEPTWEAACYYDAMMVAVEAMKRAEIDGNDILGDRRKLREALAEFSNPDLAIQGITGNIYFDEAHNAHRPLAVGIYENQQLLPAFTQYQVSTKADRDEQGHEPLKMDEHFLTPIQIVKTGINVNEVSYLNLRHSNYTIDFYLWFRFQEEFDDRNIVFPNAVTPLMLGTPIFKNVENNITTRAYHINADFKDTSTLKWYPLDRLLLPIQFQNSTQPTTKLRYVADTAKLPSSLGDGNGSSFINPLIGWTLEHISYLITTDLSQEDDVSQSFSRFNAVIQLDRIGLGFLGKNIFPIGVFMLMLYLTYYVPIDRIEARGGLLLVVSVAAGIYEYRLRSTFPVEGLLLIEYAIFVVYFSALLAAVISMIRYMLHRRNDTRADFFVSLAGRLLHPLIFALLGVGIVVMFFLVQTFDLSSSVIGK